LIPIILGYQEFGWEYVGTTDNIQIFEKKTPADKYRSVRLLTYSSASVDEIVAAVEDVSSHPQWAFGAQSAEILKNYDSDSFIYYVIIDFPFPTKDRDLVVHYEKIHDDDNCSVKLVSKSVPEYIPQKGKYVRMEAYLSIYEISQVREGQTQIIHEMQVSPGGKIPDWIVKMFRTNGPVKTMQGLLCYLDENVCD
jgi:hypothetical protein